LSKSTPDACYLCERAESAFGTTQKFSQLQQLSLLLKVDLL
jgi:hypothetical protein